MTQSSTSAAHDQPIFQQHPLSGRVTLSTGAAPTPYHIYDGYGLFIGGVCDLAAAQQLLKPETVTPGQTTAGHALLGAGSVILPRRVWARIMNCNSRSW